MTNAPHTLRTSDLVELLSTGLEIVKRDRFYSNPKEDEIKKIQDSLREVWNYQLIYYNPSTSETCLDCEKWKRLLNNSLEGMGMKTLLDTVLLIGKDNPGKEATISFKILDGKTYRLQSYLIDQVKKVMNYVSNTNTTTSLTPLNENDSHDSLISLTEKIFKQGDITTFKAKKAHWITYRKDADIVLKLRRAFWGEHSPIEVLSSRFDKLSYSEAATISMEMMPKEENKVQRQCFVISYHLNQLQDILPDLVERENPSNKEDSSCSSTSTSTIASTSQSTPFASKKINSQD